MHRAQSYFVTGTDTGVGKTFATCALLHAARSRGLTALAMKPVAAGTDANGENDDVVALCAAGSFPADPALVNPYCFREPLAPHIAAAHEGRAIALAPILGAHAALAGQADLLLVEGVGGFRVPLAPGLDTADLAQALALPVILVVGLRLGCLNHALLTAEAIRARGLRLAGWIGNRIDPGMACVEENIAALADQLLAPCLGTLPWSPDGDAADLAGRLSLPPAWSGAEAPAAPDRATRAMPH